MEEGCSLPEAPTRQHRRADGLGGALEFLRTYLGMNGSVGNEAVNVKTKLSQLCCGGREYCRREISKYFHMKHLW